ncbi:hypothetical protein MKW98_021444 [Papaver atlanticum]|uniref:Uncharacterized protein n=1 Tax=Papaver atlanticum TaxID=357466 RepID=A0AAD4SR37_9MAGN|nr:hypothetical protein MKW98_021444 [Papaver atlanticum]
MKKEELIFSWMANGFIQSERGIMEFEDIGNEIFNDLSWRSFFQDFEKYEEGNIISCKMHDLMHDLACSVMGDECLLVKGDYRKAYSHVSTSTRYVLFECIEEILGSFLETMLHIREFRLIVDRFSSLKPLDILQNISSKLKYLRVLNLEKLPISTIPNSIGNLKHLRYLNLSRTHITSIPNVLCCLVNLQILNLSVCSKLACFPPDMKKMTNLRHLDITGCWSITKMPTEMGKLIFLQTLGVFVVGKESGCGITELKDLQHLKGDLRIQGLENVNETDSRNSNLFLKKHLQSLELYWSARLSDTQEEIQAQLLVGEGLQPHPYLKRLSITAYGGVRFPHWIGAGVYFCLPNLVEISLYYCLKCEDLSQLGQLPLLRILKSSDMQSVRISEFYHHGDQVFPFFPSLEELYISEMGHQFGEISSPSPSLPSSSSQSISENQLKGIQSGDQAQVSSFPCLRILNIQICPELASFISLPPYLEKLSLNHTHEELLLIYLKQSPSSLLSLEIASFPNLVSFPVGEEVHEEGRLINVTYLSVRRCPKLKTLRMNKGSRHLANLLELEIEDCPELEFSHEDDADFQNFISLRVLRLNGLDKMTYFPPMTCQAI